MKTIKEVMKKGVVTVSSDTPVKKAAEIMSEKTVGCLIITENDRPVGIITERDMTCKIVAKERSVLTPVREIMSPKLVSIGPDDTLEDASKLMKKERIKKLPVIAQEKLIGIITSTDLALLEPQLLDEYRKLFFFEKADQPV